MAGKLVVQDSTLVTLAAKGWEYAIAECETEGGSLLTVLSKDWEEILQTNYGVSGYGNIIFKYRVLIITPKTKFRWYIGITLSVIQSVHLSVHISCECN